jgi:hypothetical protein
MHTGAKRWAVSAWRAHLERALVRAADADPRRHLFKTHVRLIAGEGYLDDLTALSVSEIVPSELHEISPRCA